MFRTGCYCDRLCVPCPEARIEILRGLHDSAMAGHNGIHKTACRVQERYWWPGMWGDINNFVTSCVTCQRNRAVKQSPWGSAQVIGTPDFAWQHLHMDWTVGFPPSRIDKGKPFNSILTFIDRLSGMAHFVPCRSTDTAAETAVHLINHVIRHHGCPERIIADNDVRLRAGFWQALTERLGITMKYTSAYHPQSNGKVENSHATLYDILRSMVTRWGDNWAEHLPLAEFAFNSSVCSSTGFSPFEIAHGRRAAFPGDLRGEQSDVPRAEAAATRIIALTTACRDHFEASQIKNQDKASRRDGPPISVGDLVLLSTKHLVSLQDKRACPRLSSRFVGPFRVVDPPDGQPRYSGRPRNYAWLSLPLTLGAIRQPINLARMRRFVERSEHLGPTEAIPQPLSIAAGWGQFCGRHIDKISDYNLAEFCVGHELQLTLPPDYYPPDHHTFPFTGPRPVRIYDTYVSNIRLQVAVYLLDLPLSENADKHEYATGLIDVSAGGRIRGTQDWSLVRALKTSFPGVLYLKDILPNAEHCVIFKNTLLPIYQIVADGVSKGGKPRMLVQFAKNNYENSAWVLTKFVPQRYVDEFWQRNEPEDEPT